MTEHRMTGYQKTKCRKGTNVERLDDEKTERVISINFYIYTVSFNQVIKMEIYLGNCRFQNIHK